MKKYECGITEADEEKGWACPIDNPNEPIDDCEGCCFAKEIEEK